HGVGCLAFGYGSILKKINRIRRIQKSSATRWGVFWAFFTGFPVASQASVLVLNKRILISLLRYVSSRSCGTHQECVMSHLLEKLRFFKTRKEPFANGHGATTDQDRSWEQGYRQRWQHDKIVRSTHGVNCTGS